MLQSLARTRPRRDTSTQTVLRTARIVSTPVQMTPRQMFDRSLHEPRSPQHSSVDCLSVSQCIRARVHNPPTEDVRSFCGCGVGHAYARSARQSRVQNFQSTPLDHMRKTTELERLPALIAIPFLLFLLPGPSILLSTFGQRRSTLAAS